MPLSCATTRIEVPAGATSQQCAGPATGVSRCKTRLAALLKPPLDATASRVWRCTVLVFGCALWHVLYALTF
jgi:hypothetical protein